MNGIDRLLLLRADNDRAGALMLSERERFRQIAARHEEGTAPRAVTGFNLFQTPRVIAARMADLVRQRLGDGDGARILEPSAGLGRLYEPLEQLRAEWVMVEESRELFGAVKKAIRRANVHNRDFLGTSPEDLGGTFDAVVMNPPFKQGRDVRHILHALDMVRAGGRLVSLCYNGTRQREALRPIATEWHDLPAGSFRSEGTSADVALIVIDR
jgi:predicted RNA methylase